MNKQDRDEMREKINEWPFEKRTTLADKTIIKLLDQLDAYERVVEAAKSLPWQKQSLKLSDALTKLEWLEDED